MKFWKKMFNLDLRMLETIKTKMILVLLILMKKVN